jgi:hypothetical protein
LKTEVNDLFGCRPAIVVAGICGLILVLKVLFAFRINVNWDEFIFLSQVYEFERGDLGARFQTAYVHLFGWLTGIGENEIDQINAARLAMSTLLIGSAILLARLAARWVSAPVAWLAPLTFLSALPVLRHAASFRADSLLLPLMLVALVCLVSKRLDQKRMAIAGIALGASIALSLKAVLIAPLALLLLMTNESNETADWRHGLRLACARVAALGLYTAATAALLLGLHWLSLPASDPAPIQGFASGVARKAVVDTPFFPRWDYFTRTLAGDWVTWAFVAIGAVVALRRDWRAALFVLSLLPLLFYRNAFPYYYVIMLAPASVLAAIGVDQLRRIAHHRASGGDWLPVIVSAPLALQAGLNLAELRHDGQNDQRATVEAVHAIFPEPVPYIDHSGMIASFPKVNVLMSSWAIENYVSGGKGFMSSAISARRPPMLLANAAILQPGSAAFDRLLAEDRQYIESYYLRYWGAIYIAGAEADIDSGDAIRLEVPFPGRYRLDAAHPVVINGIRHESGAEIVIAEGRAPYAVTVGSEKAQSVRLVWADALPRPPGDLPPFISLYASL